MSIFTKLFILSCILFSAPAFSSEYKKFMKEPFQEALCAPRVEAKAGYFFFTNKKMSELYSNGGFELQLSGSYPIRDFWHIYGAIGFIQATGKSKNFHQNTTFWQIPLDFGLKSTFLLTSFIDGYVALGPRYFYAHQHNDSMFVDRNISKSGLGLFVNMGIDFFFTEYCYMNLFGEYSYASIRPSPREGVNVNARSLQIGGCTLGAGIGYAF